MASNLGKIECNISICLCNTMTLRVLHRAFCGMKSGSWHTSCSSPRGLHIRSGKKSGTWQLCTLQFEICCSFFRWLLRQKLQCTQKKRKKSKKQWACIIAAAMGATSVFLIDRWALPTDWWRGGGVRRIKPGTIQKELISSFFFPSESFLLIMGNERIWLYASYMKAYQSLRCWRLGYEKGKASGCKRRFVTIYSPQDNYTQRVKKLIRKVQEND